MRLSRTIVLSLGLMVFLAGLWCAGYGVLDILDVRGFTERVTGLVVSADNESASVQLRQHVDADGSGPPVTYAGEIAVSQSGREPKLRPGDQLTLYHPLYYPHRARADLSPTRAIGWIIGGGAMLLIGAVVMALAFRRRRTEAE